MPPASYSYFQSWQNEPRGRLFRNRKGEEPNMARKASLFSPNNDQGVSGRSIDYGSNDLQLDPSLKAESIQTAPDLKNNQPIEARPDEGLKPHKGLFSGLFGRGDTSPQYDKYGLQMPQKHESSLFSKILQIGLPAVTGLAGGVGILPGLLSGYAGMKGGEGKEYANDVKSYNNAVAQAFNSDKLSQELGLKTQGLDLDAAKLAETIRNNKAKESLESSKPDRIDPNTPEQIFIKSAVPKMSGKQSILNTLKSTLEEYNQALNRGDEEAAYTIGARALKTINSPEGADAIGVDEAKRLGSQLNMFRTPFQIPGDYGIGRKLPEFGKSLEDNINVLQKSIDESVSQIKNPSKVLGGKQGGKTKLELLREARQATGQ